MHAQDCKFTMRIEGDGMLSSTFLIRQSDIYELPDGSRPFTTLILLLCWVRLEVVTGPPPSLQSIINRILFHQHPLLIWIPTTKSVHFSRFGAFGIFLLCQRLLFALLQDINVDSSQGKDSVNVDRLVLTVSLRPANTLCRRGVVLLLRVSQERRREDDVIGVGEVA